MDLSVAESHGSEQGGRTNLDDHMDAIVKRALPANYNFEIAKCVKRIRQLNAKVVALQMPEGLLAWGCEIADILKYFCETLEEVIIMADVTYGACCIDDITAKVMGCDLLIHYGHSCLIPVTTVTVQCLYVFVEISFSAEYLAKVVTDLFEPQDRIYMLGTIQYSNVLREAASLVDNSGYFSYKMAIPQALPLLPGEVLGCTSPRLNRFAFEENPQFTPSGTRVRRGNNSGGDIVVNPEESTTSTSLVEGSSSPKMIFIADGRFHLESALIHNPGIKAFRFDPFNKTLSEESYDLVAFHATRQDAIKKARRSKTVCLVIGMLGRQGNLNIMKNLKKILEKAGIAHHSRMVSEITLEKLDQLQVDAYIQVGCPRLSIDWGGGFDKPILNPYEAYVAFNNEEYRSVYPMDYYAKDGGDWSNYNANSKAAPLIDNKESIRLRLQQRALQKKLQYST